MLKKKHLQLWSNYYICYSNEESVIWSMMEEKRTILELSRENKFKVNFDYKSFLSVKCAMKLTPA